MRTLLSLVFLVAACDLPSAPADTSTTQAAMDTCVPGVARALRTTNPSAPAADLVMKAEAECLQRLRR